MDLNARIVQYLNGSVAALTEPQTRRKGKIPARFNPETVIGEGLEVRSGVGRFLP